MVLKLLLSLFNLPFGIFSFIFDSQLHSGGYVRFKIRLRPIYNKVTHLTAHGQRNILCL